MGQEITKITPYGEKDIYAYEEHVSSIGDRKYRYDGLKSWEELPLALYDDLHAAIFSDTTLTMLNDYHSTFDFVVKDPSFPKILVTQHHHRLLYECQMGLLPVLERIAVNIDEHDDFCLENECQKVAQKVTIGNWGSAGIDLGHWQDFVHLSPHLYSQHVYRESRTDGVVFLTREMKDVEYRFLQFPYPIWQDADCLEKLCGGKRYILSVDADSVALNHGSFNEVALEAIGNLARKTKDDPNLELIHLSLSPTHCLAKNAIAVWDYLRGVLLEGEK